MDHAKRESNALSKERYPHRSCAFCLLRGICAEIRDKYGRFAVVDKTFFRNEEFSRESLNGVLVIRHGLTVIYFNTETGDRQASIVVGRGGSLGETGVLIEGPAGDYVLAATTVVGCLIPDSKYLEALGDKPDHLKEVLQAANLNTSNFTFMTWMYQGKSVRDRIERFLAHYYVREAKISEESFIVPVSHSTLAFIVHSERATVSKALERMEDDGLLTLRQNAITIATERWADTIRAARYIADVQDTIRERDLLI